MLTLQDRYEGVCMFPSPPLPRGDVAGNDARVAPSSRDTNSTSNRETRMRPVDVHFLSAGQQLLAAYLAHGIV